MSHIREMESIVGKEAVARLARELQTVPTREALLSVASLSLACAIKEHRRDHGIVPDVATIAKMADGITFGLNLDMSRYGYAPASRDEWFVMREAR